MSHFEWVTHVNAEAKRIVDECTALLEKLVPLYEEIVTCTENSSNDMLFVEPAIKIEIPVGSGDYYDKYTESRDTWLEEFNNLETNAETVGSNLNSAISEIEGIKAEWEPKVYYQVWEEVDD